MSDSDEEGLEYERKKWEQYVKGGQVKGFVYLNCRGIKTILSKSNAEMIPYINALINSDLKNNPVDKNGYLIIDESTHALHYLIDMYRGWLEDGMPQAMSSCAVSSTTQFIYCSIARRLGFEKEFVDAIKNALGNKRSKKDASKLFTCYYCKNIYSVDEKKSSEECSYHSLDCNCGERMMYRGCKRLPWHSETKIQNAKEPRNILN